MLPKLRNRLLGTVFREPGSARTTELGVNMSNLGFTGDVRQKGFTLIEMSIVLVIIGLIIGGILKGQEIIESSRQKNLLSQVDSVRASLTTFADRYGALPGDYPYADDRISENDQYINGDGNGIAYEGTAETGATNIATGDGNNASSEELQFWIHMFGARLIEGITPTNAPGTVFGDGSPLPSAAFPGSGLSLTYGSYNDFSEDTKLAHWLVIHRNTTSPAAALSGRQMYALDLKADDGIPARGTFRTGNLTAPCGTASGTNDYDAFNDTISCRAVIDMIQ